MSDDKPEMQLRRAWELIKKNLWIFILSIAVCLVGGVLYLHVTPPSFGCRASILIKSDEDSSVEIFNPLGVSSSMLKDEVSIIKTPQLMGQVVDRLGLSSMLFEYTTPLRMVERYENSPIVVELSDELKHREVSFDIYVDANSFVIKRISVDGVDLSTLDGIYDSPIFLGGGTLKIHCNEISPQSRHLHFSQQNTLQTTMHYSSLLCVEPRKSSSIVDISIEASTPRKAEDILNALIEIYNSNWHLDRDNQIAVSNIFINERLAIIRRELNQIEWLISIYKSENLIPKPDVVASLNLKCSAEETQRLAQIDNQLSIADYIYNYITQRTTLEQQLPPNVEIASEGINDLVGEYNTLMLRRERLDPKREIVNPVMERLDLEIDNTRSLLLLSLRELINVYTIEREMRQRLLDESNKRISTNPSQELFLISKDRERSVKESLYLYLLKRREESELNSAYTPDNSKIVDRASGLSRPVNPSRKIALMVAFMMGLALPSGYIFFRESMDCEINSVKDLESLNIPILGSIPRVRVAKQHEAVVEAECRNHANEAFRVARSNLDFILNDRGAKIVQTISLLPNSGKSFTTVNLALCFALSDARVLMVDADMRMGDLSKYIKPRQVGLSSYLSGRISDVDQIISRGELHPNLDVIPIGVLPPNPTELLLNARFAELIDTLRERYDYILIDSPPVELLPDASIIGEVCSYAIFVIKAGALDRRLLPEIQSVSEGSKYPPIALLLNSVRLDSCNCSYYS